jgi:hypothetical protein
MKEYRVKTYYTTEELQKGLKVLGQLDWDVVCMSENACHYTVIFKKP